MKLVQHEQVPYFDHKLVSLEGPDVLEIDEVTVIWLISLSTQQHT